MRGSAVFNLKPREALMAKHSAKAFLFRNLQGRLGTIEILLVCEQNRSGSEKESFRWELPGGKCCDDDLCGEAAEHTCAETPEETVVRECREETGYRVAPKQIVFRRRLGRHERISYLAEITGGEPLRKKVFGRETPRWFRILELPRNLFSSHRGIIFKFLRTLLTRQ